MLSCIQARNQKSLHKQSLKKLKGELKTRKVKLKDIFPYFLFVSVGYKFYFTGMEKFDAIKIKKQ
jgi:uncharacterized protein (DUF2225 family)